MPQFPLLRGNPSSIVANALPVAFPDSESLQHVGKLP
jgi:hypothetical protein